MKIYDVLLSKIISAKVQIVAESKEKAEEIVFDQFLHNEIELEDSGIPGAVHISVSDTGALPTASSGMISIYWSDLTVAKQAEILTACGDNCNYDVFPIAEIPIQGEEAVP